MRRRRRVSLPKAAHPCVSLERSLFVVCTERDLFRKMRALCEQINLAAFFEKVSEKKRKLNISSIHILGFVI